MFHPIKYFLQASMILLLYVAWNKYNVVITIIIQHLYSAMKSEDTEALGDARLRQVIKAMGEF